MSAQEQAPQQQELTVEQALNNLAVVTGEIKGTRQDHLIIQMSLQKIAQFIKQNSVERVEVERV